MDEFEKWFEHYKYKSSQGDTKAQIALAWEYITGEKVDYDYDKAFEYFMMAMECDPDFATFNIEKANMLKNKDPYVKNVGQKEGLFPPIYYLAGLRSMKSGQTEEAVRLLRIAAAKGHIVSEFMVWRKTNHSALGVLKTLPRATYLFAVIFFKKLINPDAIEIMT